jgi:hypothetical protein
LKTKTNKETNKKKTKKGRRKKETWKKKRNREEKTETKDINEREKENRTIEKNRGWCLYRERAESPPRTSSNLRKP